MTWTPERIAAVRALLDGSADARTMWSSGPAQLDRNALARIGLAVVEARPETVERVAIALGSAVARDELDGDLPSITELLADTYSGQNKAVLTKWHAARAALAALSGE